MVSIKIGKYDYEGFQVTWLDTCPKKSVNFIYRFFFTGKYETTRQPKKSRIFSLAEKKSGQARKRLTV
jgi:hypothetical protein